MQSTWFSQVKAVLFVKHTDVGRTLVISLSFQIVITFFVVSLMFVYSLDLFGQLGNFPTWPLYSYKFRPELEGMWKILISPDTAEVQKLIADVEQLIKSEQTYWRPYTEYYANSTEMLNAYKNRKTRVLAGIVFNYDNGSNLTYALRFPGGDLPSTDYDDIYTGQGGCRRKEGDVQENDEGLQNGDKCTVNNYLFTAFSILQTAIETALIRKETGVSKFPMPEILVEMLPKPAFLQDTSYIQITSSIGFVIAYVPLAIAFIIDVMYDKQTKMWESSKMIGLRSSALWGTYLFLYCFVIIVATGLQAFLFAPLVSPNYITPMLSLFYGLSIIAFVFLFVPFFNKGKTAAVVSCLSMFLISSPYIIMISIRTEDVGNGIVPYAIPVGGMWLFCLLSPVAYAIGVDQATFLALRGDVTFETKSQGQLPMYGPVIMLLVDILLYFALAVYFHGVIPGEYGSRYKPWFIFTKAYWCPDSRGKQTEAAAYEHQIQLQLDSPTGDLQECADVEQVPDFMFNVGITIRNLTKTFEVTKEKKKEIIKAVDGLSLTIYQDQITAILGHNGSGKTTLLKILTGMTAATSGTVRVCERDVSNAQEVQKIRQMTGFCPQGDIWLPWCTCLERLRFTARIKGIANDQMEQEINTVLESVGLKDKINTIVKNLSGGQKRKLSVAIALLGNPKIIILDEPTAGMDPYSQRQLWNLLEKKKKGRVILLTTHFMEEADILADRKAIISKGSLRCCGSSLFLKNRFGLGYHLNMEVEPGCDTQKFSSLVSSIVLGSEIKRMDGTEFDITLPYDGVSKFSELFSVLEQSSTAQSLGLKTFGVSMTTLEEVFLRLEEDIDVDPDEVEKGNKNNDSTKLLPLPNKQDSYSFDTGKEDKYSEGNPSDTVNCIEGRTLFMQIFKALCLFRAKNCLTTLHFLGQLILPVIFLCIGLVLFKTRTLNKQSTSQQLPLTLSPAMYTKVKTLSNQNFPYNTIPRLLIRDTINSNLSQSLIGYLSSVYEVDQYDDSYYSDMFKLLDQDASPHYIGVEFVNLTQTGQAIKATYKVMYNDSAKHSIPATILLVNNVLLMGVEMFVQGKEDFNKSISVSSWPWPKDSDDDMDSNTATVFAVLMTAACFLIIAGILSVDVKTNRTLKIWRQLRVSGFSCTLYWLAFFVADIIKFIIPMIICIIVVFAIQTPNLMHGEAFLSFLLVCFFSIVSNTLFAYVGPYFITSKKIRLSSSLATYLFLALFSPVAVTPILETLIEDNKEHNIAVITHHIFSFLCPPYNIVGGLYWLDRIYRTAYFKDKEDSITIGDYFTMSSNLPICYIACSVHIIFFCCLLFWLRKPNLLKSNKAIPASNNDKIRGEDEDVAAERERVAEISRRHPSQLPVAVVENLRKGFKNGFVAVRNLTFAVEAGEVFGLLGPNGSGKTTTLNMITSDICPDRGKVTIGGCNILSNPSKAFPAIGYCPQHDRQLWPNLSLIDHLHFYAKMSGIPADRIPEVTNFFIDSLKIQEHKTKKVKYMSGGTKRKLSYCLSMLGKPKFVLLDEPSTGMDPQSKILLWNTISKTLKRSDRGAILTTHSMEEADILCSRIAIMVNGTMRCLGTSQHLKSKFGNDYIMEVKLNTDDDDYEGDQLRQKMKRFRDYVERIFPKAVVTDLFSDRIQYKIPKSNVKTLSRTFNVLEKARGQYDIAEYSFSQSTLKQVFLEVAKKQLKEGQDKGEDEEERQRFLNRLLTEDSPTQQTSAV